jgi:hypothetical protein
LIAIYVVRVGRRLAPVATAAVFSPTEDSSTEPDDEQEPPSAFFKSLAEAYDVSAMLSRCDLQIRRGQSSSLEDQQMPAETRGIRQVI